MKDPSRDGTLVFSWMAGAEAVAWRLGEAPGPFKVTTEGGASGGPLLPEGSRLIVERTSSGLWWVAAEGPASSGWSVDGAPLRLPQAITVGSELLLGPLKVLVWGPELSEEVPRTPIGPPLDEEPPEQGAPAENDGGFEDVTAVDPLVGKAASPPAVAEGAGAPTHTAIEAVEDASEPTLDEPPSFLLPPAGEPVAPAAITPDSDDDDLAADTVPDMPAAPGTRDGQDSQTGRLLYHLTAPREELLDGRRSLPAEGDAAPRPVGEAPRPVSMEAPAPPAGGPRAPAALASLDEESSSSLPLRHATPATASQRAPGPDDVWVLTLEHREGASSREIRLVHPTSTHAMLLVGRDPEAAVVLTDPEVAPVQLGIQLVQADVRVHPHPEAELALVVDGRQLDRPRRLHPGAILTFGRHALRVVASRIVAQASIGANVEPVRHVFQPAEMALRWQVDRPGRAAREHHLTTCADLGRRPRIVVGEQASADWPLPGIVPDVERIVMDGAADGEIVVQPLGGKLIIDGEPCAGPVRMRRGQTLEVGQLRMMLLEANVRPARRAPWSPGHEQARTSWVQASTRTLSTGEAGLGGRRLVLDLRAQHPIGAEQLVQVTAQAGWGASCVSIGREEDNDLILRVPTVSRTHAVLRFVGGGLSLRDVSGRSSVWVNRRPVQTDTTVVIGDVLTLADVRLDVVGVSFQSPERLPERRRVRVTVALQISGRSGPELFRVDRVVWSDRLVLLRVGAHPSSDITVPGAPNSLGRFEVGERGVVFVDGTGQGGRFYGGRSFERAVELVEGDAVEVGGILLRFVGASVVQLDP